MIIIGTKFNLLRHNFRLPLLLRRRNNPLRLRQSVSPLKTNNMIMLIEHCRANNIPKGLFKWPPLNSRYNNYQVLFGVLGGFLQQLSADCDKWGLI